MSAASCLRSEDQFQCSICLDVLTDPVTTSCGHNFCKNCINEHWENEDQYQCSVCKETFPTRPELKINTLLSEVVQQRSRMCFKHKRSLELFCKTDQTCVCVHCSFTDHKTHELVLLEEECEGKRAQLEKTEDELQQMIQRKRLKIEELRRLVKISEEDANRKKEEGVQVFTALKESVERSLNELIEMIEEKQRRTKKQAEDFIKELEQEISELMERSSEVEKLSRSNDHLHLLQSSSSLTAAPPTKDWTGVSVHPPSYEGTVVRAAAQLEETLWKHMRKMFDAELKMVQQSQVDVTLDPDTAHPNLILSDDGKQVSDSDVKKNLPENPKRFPNYVCVLAKQGFSSGRFYFEVQVKGKTDWILGVARESINRRALIVPKPQDGYWTVSLTNVNEYKALDDPPVRLSLRSRPQKVGVFVDHDEGLVSFYDVDAAALIFSFTGCTFTERLYPFFNPDLNKEGKNSAPLIICSVNRGALQETR